MITNSDCIFCKIISGTIPAKFIEKDDDVFVIKDIAPKAEIHYLIIPTHHYENINSIEKENIEIINKMFLLAQKISKSNNKADSYKLVINNGYEAGQRVFHLHMHFIAGKQKPPE